MRGSVAHISLYCEGYSTKSRGTFVPEKVGYCTSENRPCNAWPNSWNAVFTSSKVSSVGWPSGGLGMFRLLTTTGRVPSSLDCSTKLFIQAPPRLLLRAYQSTKNKPSCEPSASKTSNTRTSG